MRAQFEQESAYRDLRRASLMVQYVESTRPDSPEAAYATRLLELGSHLYQTGYEAFQAGDYYRAAEYAVAVKDITRAIDKMYNVSMSSS